METEYTHHHTINTANISSTVNKWNDSNSCQYVVDLVQYVCNVAVVLSEGIYASLGHTDWWPLHALGETVRYTPSQTPPGHRA